MNNHRVTIHFNKCVLLKLTENNRFIPKKYVQQFAIVDVSGGYQQQLGRTLPQLKTQLKIQVLCHQDSRFPIGKL